MSVCCKLYFQYLCIKNTFGKKFLLCLVWEDFAQQNI